MWKSPGITVSEWVATFLSRLHQPARPSMFTEVPLQAPGPLKGQKNLPHLPRALPGKMVDLVKRLLKELCAQTGPLRM